MDKRIADIIEGIIGREDDGEGKAQRDDRGGATRWGITEVTARDAGYRGDMKDLPRSIAFGIYERRYVNGPGFDRVAYLNVPIGAELVDAGVLSGPKRAAEWLQRCLRAFNLQGSLWPDIAVDGVVGPSTYVALQSFLKHRGADGERTMLAALNALQGEFFISLAEEDASQETNLYGWISKRVAQ
jgi:lysozyme family protein